jgi:hypothetical protein
VIRDSEYVYFVVKVSVNIEQQRGLSYSVILLFYSEDVFFKLLLLLNNIGITFGTLILEINRLLIRVKTGTKYLRRKGV